MNDKCISSHLEFDDTVDQLHILSAEKAANSALALGTLAMQFARVERIPRYDTYSRENDAEHSFMLSLVATELAEEYFPNLDSGLVSKFGTVHDLVEIETGDVATFDISEADLQLKQEAEHQALGRLLTRLPARTAKLLETYEEQELPEARFVRFIDKLLPIIVDIAGPGRKVMEEDYNVHSPEQLLLSDAILRERQHRMFPEPELQFVHHIRDILSDQFTVVFESTTTA